MESLFEQFAFKIRNIDFKHKRFLYEKIDWNRKLVILKGTRKVGKSTLVLQYVKEIYKYDSSTLYVSADNIYFSDNTIVELATKFVLEGGKHLLIDEIHKYFDWEIQIEAVLNKFDSLKITLIGTSAIEINSDFLKKQASIYTLAGLSFREFILFTSDIYFESYSLEYILENHAKIATEISTKIDYITYFQAYLKFGYYPFFVKDRSSFVEILSDTLNSVFEIDLTYAKNVDFKNISKIKRLLYYIASRPLLRPNISELSKYIGATRGTILQYLDYLAKANIINLYKNMDSDDGQYVKPEIIYLQNTNLYNLLSVIENDCFVEKTYFQSQVTVNNEINFAEGVDFIVNNKYEFIINRNNSSAELLSKEGRFYATDNIEIGVKNKIPLWMFGFMY